MAKRYKILFPPIRDAVRKEDGTIQKVINYTQQDQVVELSDETALPLLDRTYPAIAPVPDGTPLTESSSPTTLLATPTVQAQPSIEQVDRETRIAARTKELEEVFAAQGWQEIQARAKPFSIKKPETGWQDAISEIAMREIDKELAETPVPNP